ncbi:MlaD family protein [soil metagenome]
MSSDGEATTVSERRRLPLVWIIPIVAALAALWLGYRALADRGPEITIHLKSAEGLEAGRSKIKHRDVELGTVVGLVPSDDLSSVTVQARMNGFAEPHLKEQTKFWVVRPRLSAEGVSGLGTLVSGAYIEMDPGDGKSIKAFTGLEEPPILTPDVPGTIFEVRSPRLGSVYQAAPVIFHGVKVGQVLGYRITEDGSYVSIQVFVQSPHDQFVREGSRFWNASGLTVDAGPEGVRLHVDSLQALVTGGVAFDLPDGGEPGPAAKALAVFSLYRDENDARRARYTHRIRFLVQLPGDASGVVAGSAVRLRGVVIGQVTDVHMEFSEITRRLSVPVTLEIEPERVKLVGKTPYADLDEGAYAAFREFVERGLRARVQSSNILTGQKVISLEFVPNAPKRGMIEGGLYPEIPAVQSSDVNAILQSAQGLLESLNETTARMNSLVGSPQMKRSLDSLDRSLSNLDKITHDVSVQAEPLLSSLREVTKSADEAVKQAQQVLNTAQSSISPDGQSADIAGTLDQLKQAARSTRVLTEYLERHPEALIRGKPADKAH